MPAKRKVGRPKKKIGASQRKIGRGFFSSLLGAVSKAVPFLQDTKLISKGANALGFNNVGNIASSLGFGKVRNQRKRRVKRAPKRAPGAPKRKAGGASLRPRPRGGALFHSLPYNQVLSQDSLHSSARRLGGSGTRLGGSILGDIAGAVAVSKGVKGRPLYNLTHM